MKVFIVYYHPEPRSFNGAMLATAVSTFEDLDHEVQVSNLHEMNFNPVSGRHNFSTVKDAGYYKQQLEEIYATELQGFSIEIEAELNKIEWCDLMIWQFPLWWFGLPAPLKGWVDRVFAMGRTYGDGKYYDNGVFTGKKAVLSLTTGGPEDAYFPGGFNGDINGILRPIHRGMLEFVGFKVLAPTVVYGPVRLSQEERVALLTQYKNRLRSIEHEESIAIGTY